MSIWGSRFHLSEQEGDPPYIDYAGTADGLDSIERGGSVDLATSGWADVVRLSLEGPDDDPGRVYLDYQQLKKLHAAIELIMAYHKGAPPLMTSTAAGLADPR